MKKVMNMLKKMKHKNWSVVMLNSLALVMVIQNLNSTCLWVDGQPDIPEEALELKHSKA